MNKESSSKIPWLMNPKSIGPALEEVAIDYIEVNNQKVTSRWLKSEDTELFIWTDASGNIIKQQMSVFGQVVEWNIFDGVRSGLLIESDLDTDGKKISENVRFDIKPHPQSIQQMTQILHFVKALNSSEREKLIANFQSGSSSLPKRGVMTRFKEALKKLFS